MTPWPDSLPEPGDDLSTLNDALERAPVAAVLAWAWRASGGTLAATSSFQTQSVPLLHMIAEAVPEMPVLFLDTGFHFPETLAFRDTLARQLGLNLRVLTPRLGHDGFRRQHGALHAADPDRCCFLNKVEPLQDALRDYRGWVAGVRRDQTSTRAAMTAVAWDAGGRLKLSPMLAWGERDIWQYLHDHDLPEHPLLSEGYLSVGCAPCTRRVRPGESARAGRWAGSGKTECGLHLAPDPERVD